MEASTADPAIAREAPVVPVQPDPPAPVEPEPITSQAEPGSIELVTGKTINLKDMAIVRAAFVTEGLPSHDGTWLALEHPNGSPYNVRASAIIAYE
jgi:hypothetical protein